MMRRRMEAASYIFGELSSTKESLGEHARELLSEEATMQAFEQRRASGNSKDRPLTAGSQMGSSPSESSSHLDGSWPPALHSAASLGTSFRSSRPLTVTSSNNALYMTSASAISYPGRKFGRTSSLASLQSVAAASGEIQLPPLSRSGSFGGPSTFKVEDPLKCSRTYGLMTRNPSVEAVLEARWPNTSWGVLSTAPYRPALRAALEGLNNDDMRWVNGNWTKRGKVSTPRSERVARFR